VDPRGDFESFEARLADATEVQTIDELPEENDDTRQAIEALSGCILPEPEELTGDYLVAFSSPIAPAQPLVALVSMLAESAGDRLRVTLSRQYLSAGDLRTPAGDPEEPTVIELEAGPFEWELRRLVVPAAANPVLPAEIESQVVLSGELCSVRGEDPDAKLELFCGDMSGMIFRPLQSDLAGSSFAGPRIDDLDAPYPPVVIDCDGTPAQLETSP